MFLRCFATKILHGNTIYKVDTSSVLGWKVCVSGWWGPVTIHLIHILFIFRVSDADTLWPVSQVLLNKIGVHTCPLVYVHKATFVLQCHNWMKVEEGTVFWQILSKIFTIWSFTEEVCQSLLQRCLHLRCSPYWAWGILNLSKASLSILSTYSCIRCRFITVVSHVFHAMKR